MFCYALLWFFLLKMCQLYPLNVCMKCFTLLKYFMGKHTLIGFLKGYGLKTNYAKSWTCVKLHSSKRFKCKILNTKTNTFHLKEAENISSVIFLYQQFLFNLKMEGSFSSLGMASWSRPVQVLFVITALWRYWRQLPEGEAPASWLRMLGI